MRKVNVEYDVYKFEELTEKVQQKVLEKLWDINLYEDWHEFTLEHFKEKLEEIGFEDAKIHYSGFCSQGDGASFDAHVNLEKIINYIGDKRFNKLLHLVKESYIDVSIVKTSYANHYSHKKTRYIEVNTDFNTENYLRVNKLCDLLCDYIEDLRIRLCEEIYETLEKEYDYLTSKEQIIECINANEYEFLESGKAFWGFHGSS